MQSVVLTERQLLTIHFHTIQDALLHLSEVVHRTRLMTTAQDMYAHGLVQKANLQLMAIRHLYEVGQWHSTISEQSYNYILDPITVGMVLRGAYECILTLNHVFVGPTSTDEFQVRYLLWEIETHNSQLQIEPTEQAAVIDSQQEIRATLNHRVDLLLKLPLVQSLDEKSKQIIRGKALPNSGTGWEYYIEGSALKRVDKGWHGLARRVEGRPNALDNFYKLFSLASHPTWYSVHHVLHDYSSIEGEEPENLRLMDDMLELASVTGVLLLYDYCTLFPEAMATFRVLPTHLRAVINQILAKFKGDVYELT